MASFVKYVRVSGTFYLEASDQYPHDEEYSGWYLKCASANMMEIRSPLSLVLPIVQNRKCVRTIQKCSSSGQTP
ncbi:hypothetical protein PTI98_009909 [Pleurotus ostreatus]|nr:hypothetical protein PTI98_009909 [Pleurotus ostreatus]